MRVSQSEYERIINEQRTGRLTVFIDTAAFRRLFVNRINPRKISVAIGESIESRMQIIQALTYADATVPLIASILAVIAFGWLGILGVAFAVTLWSIWKQHACRGAQGFMDVSIAVSICIAVMFFFARAWSLDKCFSGFARSYICYGAIVILDNCKNRFQSN